MLTAVSGRRILTFEHRMFINTASVTNVRYLRTWPLRSGIRATFLQITGVLIILTKSIFSRTASFRSISMPREIWPHVEEQILRPDVLGACRRRSLTSFLRGLLLPAQMGIRALRSSAIY